MRVLVLSILLLTSLCCTGQVPPLRSTQAYAILGIQYQEHGSHHPEFLFGEAPRLDQSFTALGFGGNAIVKHWVLGGQVRFSMNRNNANQEMKLSSFSSCGGLQLGYLLLETKGKALYPTLGLELGGEQLLLTSKTGEGIQLNGEQYFNGLSATVQKAQYSFSIHMDWFLGQNSSPGVLLGLEMGYRYQAYFSEYLFENPNGSPLETVQISDPHVCFATLKLGLGTFKRSGI